MTSRKAKKVWEFGDFQTPESLARQVTWVIKGIGTSPQSIIEPSCGRGVFLFASADFFPDSKKLVGVEINKEHLETLHRKIETGKITAPITTICASFFDLDWSKVLGSLSEPILIIGNPPWVTSAELRVLQSYNLPEKSNFQGYRGLEALTGKSNFDISEWMLIQHLEWLRGRIGIIAMLCKTAVARKVLIHAWKYDYSIKNTKIYRIDAWKHFNAAVDACLFVIEIGHSEQSKDCDVFESLSSKNSSHTIGYHNNVAVADIGAYREWQHLYGNDKSYIWRSGVKHDCSKVMELVRKGRDYSNGNGIIISLENTYIYPLLKSSDIGNGRVSECRKYMLVTQQYIGEDTAHIENDAPKTWRYLQDNARAFRNRSSSIYRNRPPFSIFGVGDYSFAPWKVAISGFYKKLKFTPVGAIEGRTVICDDTIYFLACWSELEARFISEILNSAPARRFLDSMVFWSNKRPITIDLLKRLNIRILARTLGREDEYLSYLEKRELNK